MPEPCVDGDIATIPATQPLRIFKQRLKTDSAISLKGGLPPYSIPRRHSSYAIRRTQQFANAPPLPPLPPKQESPRSYVPHATGGYSHPGILSASRAAVGGSMGSTDRGSDQGRRVGSNNTLQRASSRGGLFARVFQALDFNRPRQPSPAAPDFAISDQSPRAYVGASSGNPQRYASKSNVRDDAPPNPLSRSQTSGRKSPPCFRPNLHVAKHRTRVHARSARPPPITNANINVMMDAMKISAREDLFTWVAVEITASVSNLSGDIDTQTTCDVPLDVMIIVDNSATMSPELLKGACNTVLHVASSMDMLIDRLAIGCISADPEQNLQLLLPLGTCNLDVIQRLLRSMHVFRLQHDEPNQTRVSKALHEAANLLMRCSSRGALRHIFVVTSNSTISLRVMSTNIKSRIRFHTISPEPVLVIRAPEHIDGWHLPASFDDEEDHDGIGALKDNLKEIMRHLRMGLDPGFLSDLSVSFSGAAGCSIEAILGDPKCACLRPGEKWTILVKVKAVSENAGTSRGTNNDAQNTTCADGSQVDSDVDHIIDQLHGLLGSSNHETQNLFSVILEYNHSAFSNGAVIRLENKCEITLFPQKKNSLVRDKSRRALQRDASELYDQENAVDSHSRPIRSMHLSCHLDHRLAGYETGDNDMGDACGHTSVDPALDQMVHSSPVSLGSMNPFRNLVRGCDENCVHGLASDENRTLDQPLIPLDDPI
ncbi:hypothetical protein FQN52_008006 [Onygenales sp. PD_12]|nr:hypothetical protein FQN52_008006 [Onygenales sp. PD_12]KAK2792818.1 hypothetical protein FQN51_001578 [Onygenales sp. PD_10]